MAELRSVALPLTAALCTAVATVVALRSASGGVVSPSVRPSAPATSHAALYFVLALAFNAAAFVNVEYGNGRIATVNNPLAGSVILTAFAAAFCRAAVRAKGSDKPLPLAWAATLLGVLVAISGVAKHLRLAGAYIASADAGSHHRYLWAVGVAINVFGTMMFGRVADYCLRLIAAKPNVYRVVSVLVLITISTGLVLRGMQAPAGADSSDCARWHTPKAGQLLHRFQLNKTSAYLRMRDGVKLAADIYLPTGPSAASADFPRPTILHITRYNRAVKVAWPFSLLLGDELNTRSPKYVDKMVKSRGYALVTVDTRGSGASFGKRPFDLAPAEVADHQEVLEWVIAQPWCNGKVGTGGISYDGMSAFRLASGDKSGAVRAAALMFSPVDPYSELLVPGGLLDIGFFGDYTTFTSAAERNIPVEGVAMPLAVKFAADVLTAGVAPVVPGDPSGDLAAAVAGHAHNWNMTTMLSGRDFIDEEFMVEESSNRGLSALDFIPTEDAFQGLAQNKVATHVYGGYYDSGSVRGSIEFAERMRSAGASIQLTIGPWTHGARQTCSPWNRGQTTTPCFDIFEDVANFWDKHLREPAQAIEGASDADVRVFTIGSEKWTFHKEWPAAGDAGRHIAFALSHNGNLRQVSQGAGAPSFKLVTSPSNRNEIFHYKVDTATTSGVVSRWNLVQSLLRQPVDYADRSIQDERCLTFTSPPLAESVTLAGAPLLSFFIDISDGSDAAVFAYLEIIDTDGNVVYLTEGQMRAAHSPALTFRKIDFTPLQPGQTRRVNIQLEPISAALEAGWQIRLAVAGADQDNFLLSNIDAATQWKIFAGRGADSSSDSAVEGSGLLLQVE